MSDTIINEYGGKEWWVDDKLHRVDGPAVEYADGDKAWYVDGKLHRVGGPAVEYADGYRAWWVDGKLHRVDGPAVERKSGTNEWWVCDKRCKSNKAFQKAVKLTDEEMAKVILKHGNVG